MLRHNPYATASKRPPDSSNSGTGQKRSQRPWEINSNSSSQQRPRPTTTTNVSSPSSEFNCSFDDTGFDWDAALKTIDAACDAAAAAASAPSQQNASHHDSRQTTTLSTLPSVASTSSKENQKMNATVNGIPLRAPSKPPTHNNNNNKLGVPPNQATLSSLRPTNWSSSLSSSSNNNNQYNSNNSKQTLKKPPTPTIKVAPPPFGDERQAGLPKPLQFPKSRLLPVDDEHGEELYENAALDSPLLNGWTLFPHQVDAVTDALLQRRFILALDMGLGKTLIGCVFSRAFLNTEGLNCKHALILCPVSLSQEWKRTAEEATGLCVKDPSGKTGTKRKKKKSRKKKGKKHAGLYDSDDDEEDDYYGEECRHDPNVSIHSWAKVPPPPEEDNFIVIGDEAHSIQSMSSNRTISTLQLVSHKRCIGCLLLTGTPMKNGKPSNLFPLLKAVKHPLGNHQRAYEAHFCQGREVRFGNARPVWQANGSAHLDQLHELTQSHMLHLTKESCLKDLPPQTRLFEDVPVSSRKQLQHNEALKELARAYAYSKNSGENDGVLGAVTKVRMIGSFAKIEATCQFAMKTLQDEPAVVIFTSFLEVASQVHKKLQESGWRGELLTGETPAKKRQGMVDNFQKGISPVFVCTFGAGGVGLTLTAAHTVILLDRPWTPGDATQAEDRVRRIGQTKPVRSVWMRAFEIDKQIDDMIAYKAETSSAVLTKDMSGKKSTGQAQKISITKLIEAVLPNTQSKNNGDGMKQTSILQFSQPTEDIDD